MLHGAPQGHVDSSKHRCTSRMAKVELASAAQQLIALVGQGQHEAINRSCVGTGRIVQPVMLLDAGNPALSDTLPASRVQPQIQQAAIT